MKNKILLFISIVMFISANTYSQGNIFTLSNGKKVEIAEKVSSERMCYGAALKLCNNLGVGWRIPSAEEQKELSLNKDKIGGYVETEKNLYAEGYRSAWYYTSTPRYCEGQEKCVISICISDGSDGTAGTETTCYYWVRPIRDYNSSITNSSPNNSQTSSQTGVTTQNSTTPVSSLPDGDIIWKHSKGSFEIKGKEGDKRIWHEDGGRFIYVEQEFYNDGTMEGSGQLLKRKNENVFIKLTLDKCYYKDNNNQNWILIYNGGFYSKTLARYLVVDDFNKSSQSTSTTSTTTTTSQSNVTVNKTVSNYKFTPPPALKINYIDNRKMCCCCNEKYVQYKLEDKKKLEVQQKIYYCTEKLALFHRENGNGAYSSTVSKEQIDLDLKKLQDELIKIYPNYGLEIGFGSSYWYQLAALGMGMKLGSTERDVNLYENVGNHCSLKCKNICGSCR
jgi:hypothetical protein